MVNQKTGGPENIAFYNYGTISYGESILIFGGVESKVEGSSFLVDRVVQFKNSQENIKGRFEFQTLKFLV